MRIVRDVAELRRDDRPRLVAVGVFDGVHRGHQRILRELVSRAAACGGRSVALTFEPHPLEVVGPNGAPPLLTPPQAKLDLMAELGVDTALVMDFSPDLARMSPREFAVEVLGRALGSSQVLVGFNFTFGHRGQGRAGTLVRLGREAGFKVTVFPPIRVGGRCVSSSAVRELVQGGEVDQAALLLGRPHRVGGVVEAGERRGRALGFPTANLRPDPALAYPAPGVYAVTVLWGGRSWGGVANLGQRPTFGGGRNWLEVHLLGFDGDLYGQWLEVDFERRLRDERRFGSVEELRAQIARDVSCAQAVLRDLAGADGGPAHLQRPESVLK
ncbi:MAG: bifunctional riboflavin kinase/FAD synthetase [Acetobacteraceae bacterium]|nr:bifunctional riboflavin kinase/FAD synthetase [Acetobacteraceae bacterium]